MFVELLQVARDAQQPQVFYAVRSAKIARHDVVYMVSIANVCLAQRIATQPSLPIAHRDDFFACVGSTIASTFGAMVALFGGVVWVDGAAVLSGAFAALAG
jgi:hypothetical protein